MKVINLLGGPGVGKSVTASQLFAKLKRLGANVELVTEYAKDMVWENRDNILEDQLYILAKQNRKLSRLLGLVDYAITDCPLLLGLAYTKPDYYKEFHSFLMEVWNSYDNQNFYLVRSPKNKYQAIGRVQNNLEEAILYDKKIWNLLQVKGVAYTPITCDDDVVSSILRELVIPEC